MKFAVVDGARLPAEPGLKGHCPVCKSEVIAKCGTMRIWHWAHRGTRTCDHWWEPETEWHRAWKNLFPSNWQEVVHFDQNGEKHVADVKTPQDLVIEIQHSSLSPEERRSREAFYGNMVWIVDGTRLKRDLQRFVEERRFWRSLGLRNVFITPYPENALPDRWLDSNVPVYFDFDGGPNCNNRHLLWCLFPKRAFNQSVIVAVSRRSFVQQALQHRKIMDTDALTRVIEEGLHNERRAKQLNAVRTRSPWRKQARPWKYGYRKRRKPRF